MTADVPKQQLLQKYFQTFWCVIHVHRQLILWNWLHAVPVEE